MTISKSTKDTIDELGVGVESECGKLDIVIMHRPGRELLRLTEDTLDHVLYDALPNIDQTHQSHDIFSQYLRQHGVHVLYLTDLLLETLTASAEARKHLIDGLIAHSHLNQPDQQQALSTLRQWLLDRTPEQLAQDVIVGVSCSPDELGTSDHARELLKTKHLNHHYVIQPLPNLLFTRDGFSIMEKNVFIWQMNKPARRNEPFLIQIIFQYHPCLSTSGLKLVEWRASKDHNNNDNDMPTIEGGDVAYIGNGVVMIGCSERTNRAGIEAVARTGLFHQVIAINIPPNRCYMHLDTVLSSVGKHAFTLHGSLGNNGSIHIRKER
ncbi:hypothetical protein I4U23_012874 [Adineta vaga]|nr:hypothetical protein I4U23_012874 [Adineta vaga]